jgi:ATP-dependent DNA helicase UvrD/PcrA
LQLARLAHIVLSVDGSGVLDRLQHIYDDIYIDEVQDLGGWDLEVVEALLRSDLRVTMVGDMRQALLSTNIRDPKNSQFRREKIINWFRLMEARGLLEIEHRPKTFRSNQVIATFSDTIFDASLGYTATISESTSAHWHTGLFTVREEHAAAYAEAFQTRCLRHSVASGSHLTLPFINFGMAKGTSSAHVLIYPTARIQDFLRGGAKLTGQTACALYIGVTRAQHSVAFIMDDVPEGFIEWRPR